MSTPTALRFRDARDRMIDLLGLGETYPLRDLTVRDDRLTVAFGSTAKVPVEISQPDVTYGLRDKDGHSAGVAMVGTGDTVLIETPTIHDDITYTVHARKPSGREADLFTPGPVKVGLDLDLAATIATTDPGVLLLVDYGSTVTVQILHSQDGVDYRLVRFPTGDPPHPDDMEAAAGDDILSADDRLVRGTGGPIELPSKPMAEDTVLRIRAIKVFDASLARPPQTNLLAARLPLLVRADPGRPVVADPAPIVGYQGAAAARVGKTQGSAFYRAFAHQIADPEYQQGATPGPGIAAVKVDGQPDALVLLPPLPAAGGDLPGSAPIGAEQAGTGADLVFALPPVAEDTVVAVQARKQHQTADGPVISAVWLAQTAVVLARPDPNAEPRLLVTVQDGKTTGTLDVIGGQPGVFYTPSITPPAAPIAPPAYVHKRDTADATFNKGLGQLKLEVDYVLARDPPGGGSPDLAHTPPLSPSLTTDPLAAGATIALHAMKAQTRVGADLAATAALDPMPELHVDPLINFGAPARVEVRGSRVTDSYELLRDSQVVGASQDGTGATLTFVTDPLRQDAVLEIAAVSKATIPVERRGRLPVVVRPDPSRPVAAKDATVPSGTATAILVDVSQPGVAYQLVARGAPVGTAVAGTGAAIALPTGPITTNITFSVAATRSDNAATTVTLAQTATVAVKPA
jgi:hypothetical protein